MGDDVTRCSSKREHRCFVQAFVTTLLYFGFSSASTPVAATEVPALGGYYAPAYPYGEAGPFETEMEAKSMALAYLQSPVRTYCHPLAPWPSELACTDDHTLTNIETIGQDPLYPNSLYSYRWMWYIEYDGQRRERLFGGFFYSSDWAVTAPGHIEVYTGVLLWEHIIFGGGAAVRVNYTCPSGYWLVGDPPLIWQPGSPRPTCADQGLVVRSPTSGSQYPLGQNDTTAVNITYHADDRPVSTSQVNWTATLDYATSGGRGTSQIVDAFTSPANSATVRDYQSQGGRLTISAWETTASGTVFSRPKSYYVYIVGAPIADSAITSRLVGLYTRGATPNLLTGIANVESSYRQFTN